MKWSRTIRLIMAGLCTLAGAIASAMPGLPASGVVDPDEGTIECWIRLDFDPLQKHESSYRVLARPFRVVWADPMFPDDGLGMKLVSRYAGYRSSTGMWFGALVGAQIGGVRALKPSPNLWAGFGQDCKANEWHHVALTWSVRDRRMDLYVNGQRRGGRKLGSTFMALTVFKNAVLTFGGGHIALDDLRISCVARPVSELGVHGNVTLDAATTLLFRFDRVEEDDGRIAVSPDYAAIRSARQEYSLPDGWHPGEGMHGKALVCHPRDGK